MHISLSKYFFWPVGLFSWQRCWPSKPKKGRLAAYYNIAFSNISFALFCSYVYKCRAVFREENWIFAVEAVHCTKGPFIRNTLDHMSILNFGCLAFALYIFVWANLHFFCTKCMILAVVHRKLGICWLDKGWGRGCLNIWLYSCLNFSIWL